MRRGGLAAATRRGGVRHRIAFVMLGAMLLAGSVSILGCSESKPAQATLQERASRYLELKQKRDWAVIYSDILDPEARKVLKREDFLRKRENAFDVLAFTLVSTDQQAEQGKVVARLDAMIPVLDPKGGTTTLPKKLDDSQRWIQRSGTWYIQLDE